MSMRGSFSYMSTRYGTVMANSRSITKGHKVDSFSFILGQVYNGHNYYGNTVNTSTRRTVSGAIWLSRPTGPYDTPDYISSNSINVSNCYQVPKNSGGDPDSGTVCTFNFDNAICNTSTIYIGLYTPYEDGVSAMAYVGDDDVSLIYNQATSITSWSGHGLYVNSFDHSLPYYDTTISITSPASNSLHRHDQNMTVNWSAWSSDGTTSQTWITINGNRVNANSGNSAGSRTFKPSDYGVGSGKSFTVVAYRKHQTGRNTASSSRTFRTYTVPTVSNVQMSPNPVSANVSTRVSWTGNSATFSGETINSSISINRSNYISTGTTNSWSGTMRSYVPVSKDNQNVTITVRRTNSATNVSASASLTTARVLYTPTKPVTNLKFRANSSTGSVINPGSTIDKSVVNSVYVTWTVPTGNNVGVISGYRIIVTSANGTTKTYYTTTNSYNIPVSYLVACQSHTIQVNPYYLESGRYYIGPSITSNFVLPMSRINTPVIRYPVNNTSWLNPGYRILTTLPTDPDYSSLPSDIQAGYRYNDIELSINDVSILWSQHPEIFSVDVLSYTVKLVINPTLTSLYQYSSSPWKIKYRVKKSYGDTDSSIAWSNWSSVITVTLTARTFNVNAGDEIMASHYNSLITAITSMRSAYPVFTMSSSNVTAGQSIIQRSDYTKAYNDLRSIVNYVNSYGDYSSSKSDVKFPTLPTFTPQIEEIEAHEIANYIRKMYNFANSLCNVNLVEDIEMEEGSIDFYTGENINYENQIRCKDYVEVEPSTVYKFYRCGGISNSIGMREYNSNKEFIRAGTGNVGDGQFSVTFTTSSTTSYIRFTDQDGNLNNKYLLMLVRSA